MPIIERAIRKLTNDELLQIMDLPAFIKQREQLLGELLFRSGFDLYTFKKLHIRPDCNIEQVQVSSRVVKCVDPTLNVGTVERRYLVKLVCRGHEVQSMEFIDHSLTEILGSRTF